MATQLAEKLNQDPATVKVLIPTLGWSGADRKDGPLYAPEISRAFTEWLKELLNPLIEVREVNYHINDAAFAQIAAGLITQML